MSMPEKQPYYENVPKGIFQQLDKQKSEKSYDKLFKPLW